jgi:23S rRNA (pseudouridine1915-N3)-methyltransferase
MKISIINIANKMPQWITVACDEYLKRINYGKYSCRMIEIKSDKNPNRSAMDVMASESKKIKVHIPFNAFIVALDEKGSVFTSKKFAHKLEQISQDYPNIVILIGGADGLHPELKQMAHLILQLSTFTLPHGIVRVVILEQIYRALTILDNHPYHRD